MKRTLIIALALLIPSSLLAEPLEAGAHPLPTEVSWKNVVALDGDAVLTGSGADEDTHIVTRLDTASGEVVWKRELRLPRMPRPLGSRGALIVMAGPVVVGLDPATGEERYRTKLGDRHAQFITSDHDADRVLLRSESTLTWRDMATGEVEETITIPDALLDKVYYAWWTGEHIVTQGSRGDVRTTVALDPEAGQHMTLNQETGPHDGMLGMILLGGARDPMDNPQRSDFSITARSTDDEHWQLEAWRASTGEVAWIWEKPMSPSELSRMEIEDYGSFDHDTTLFVNSTMKDGEMHLEAFAIADRSPAWTLDLDLPESGVEGDSGRLARIRELSGDRVLLALRSNNIFETWFRHVVVHRKTGELLWSAAEPLDYPDDTSVSPSQTHLLQIMAPWPVNSRAKKKGSPRPQTLVITALP